MLLLLDICSKNAITQRITTYCMNRRKCVAIRLRFKRRRHRARWIAAAAAEKRRDSNKRRCIVCDTRVDEDTHVILYRKGYMYCL